MTAGAGKGLQIKSIILRPLCRDYWSSSIRHRKHYPDYSHDDGMVEGIWIFTRHGDRSPGRCLSPAHRRKEEAAYWISKLPFPDSTTAYRTYSRFFPLEIGQNYNQGSFLDTPRNPFGFLSQKGLRQLKESGHRYFNRYNHHGHHLPGQPLFRWEYASDFLQAWDVNVYSTNYLRTVLSAQSFLDGLLGTHCFSPSSDREENHKICEEDDLPDHSWRYPKDDDLMVKINVRELSKDPLNAFDRNPGLISDLVSEVMTTKEFQARDAAAVPLASRLANVLPGLIRPRRSDFSSRSPSGINWVEAADHFVCRESHGLPLARFTDFDNDLRVEQTLKAMSHQTKAHLAWRFRQWYKNRKLLSAIAGPPFREILNQMLSTTSLGDSEKRRFTLYSCHDITILGILYGLGADFLAGDLNPGVLYWPPYASTLAIELVRTNDHRFRVRTLLDGVTVKSVDFANPTHPSLSSTPDGLLSISDFQQLVEQLEDDGGPAAKL